MEKGIDKYTQWVYTIIKTRVAPNNEKTNMKKFEKLGNGLELVFKQDGYHALVTIPMYATNDTFLFTSNREVAISRAKKEYENQLQR